MKIGDKRKHMVERVVDALVERFDRKLNVLIEWGTVDGRPIFTVPLSDAEKFQRYQDVAVRSALMTALLAEGGPAAVRTYLDDMRDVAIRLSRKAHPIPLSTLALEEE